MIEKIDFGRSSITNETNEKTKCKIYAIQSEKFKRGVQLPNDAHSKKQHSVKVSLIHGDVYNEEY